MCPSCPGIGVCWCELSPACQHLLASVCCGVYQCVTTSLYYHLSVLPPLRITTSLYYHLSLPPLYYHLSLPPLRITTCRYHLSVLPNVITRYHLSVLPPVVTASLCYHLSLPPLHTTTLTPPASLCPPGACCGLRRHPRCPRRRRRRRRRNHRQANTRAAARHQEAVHLAARRADADEAAEGRGGRHLQEAHQAGRAEEGVATPASPSGSAFFTQGCTSRDRRDSWSCC